MASSIGTSHLVSAQPCQDNHGGTVLRDARGRQVVALVAADGAGSAAVADVGASLACHAFITLVSEYLASGGEAEQIGRPLAERWVAGIVFRLIHHAQARGLAAQDYACTLLAAVVTDTTAAFFQIGDGAIVVPGSTHAAWEYIFWPQHGEFANTTNFITSDNPMEALEFASREGAIDEIAIFTDGIENLVLRKAEKTVHGPFFDSMFRSVRRSTVAGVDDGLGRQLEQYLSSEAINSRTHDDKTLILASRRHEQAMSWTEAPA